MDTGQMILLIVIINIVYVSLATVRMIFVMKGQRVLAPLLSMVEVFTYLIGLTIVLNNIHKPANIVAYCVGWGMGVFLGSKIEEWLALGYVTLQIVVDNMYTDLPKLLREKGYGVTSWAAEGMDGPRLSMIVLTKRRNEQKLSRTIHELAPKAFVISHEPRYFRGGFWAKRLK